MHRLFQNIIFLTNQHSPTYFIHSKLAIEQIGLNFFLFFSPLFNIHANKNQRIGHALFRNI